MSLLPSATFAAPGVPLFAPASGGGGGGLTGNPIVSSLTFNGNTPTFDLVFPPGYNGTCRTDELQFLNATGPSVITLTVDTTGGITHTNDPGIIIQDNSSAANVQITQGTTAAISIGGTPGNYLSIDTCVPDLYRAQFLDAGVPLAFSNPLVGQLTATGIGGMNVLDAAGNGWVLNTSSLNVSSVNGAAPGGGSVPGNLTVSSLTLAGSPTALGATLNLTAEDQNLYTIGCVSSAVTLADFSVGFVGGRNQVYANTLEAPNFYTSTITGTTGVIALNPTGTEQIRIGGVGAPGDITITTTGGGNINLIGPVNSSNTINLTNATSALVNISSAANAIQLKSDNTATATIWATGVSGLALSTVTSFNGGIPITMNPAPSISPAQIQVGYCQDASNASTILFTQTYPSDSIAVILTPTNRNVTGGANPNLSLNNSWGPAGRGVSSIGFQVDARNGGVGYQGSFFWMAIPTNTV